MFWAEFLVSRFFFLTLLVIGIPSFVCLILWMNRSIGITNWHDEVWVTMRSDPNALAIYFGARILAVGIVVGGLAIAGAIAGLIF